jgi:hypothetical protein
VTVKQESAAILHVKTKTALLPASVIPNRRAKQTLTAFEPSLTFPARRKIFVR